MSLLVEADLIVSPERSVRGGGLLIAKGRVVRVLESARARSRAVAQRRLTLPEDCVVSPGLVNAHAHLELSHLKHAVPRGAGFSDWIGNILKARGRSSAAEYEAAFVSGAERALSSGTTTVGDIDSTGAASAKAAGVAPRVRVYREVLDAQDETRAARALARVRKRLPRRAGVFEGLSPHAPLTVSPGLLASLGSLAQRHGLAVSSHWAETEDEERWLRSGEGPWAEFFGARGPGPGGLDRLETAGLLSPRTSLVHGNHPGRGELARVAKSGASLVHCPGSHRFFGREPFPWRRYRSAGVELALGTDSLASNDDLDLVREMVLARSSPAGPGPDEVFALATRGGARAVGLAGEVGELIPGARADFIVWRADGEGPSGFLDRLSGADDALRPVIEAVFLGGVRRFSASRA